MRTYAWWKKQKRRVQKKYTLVLGRYLSPKEVSALAKWLRGKMNEGIRRDIDMDSRKL